VRLICDEPLRETFVLFVPHNLTAEERQHLQVAWDAFLLKEPPRVLVLEGGMTLQRLDAAPSWPDAVACAA
jgi:hypothetical protein